MLVDELFQDQKDKPKEKEMLYRATQVVHLTYDEDDITSQNEKDALFNERWRNNQLSVQGKWNWTQPHSMWKNWCQVS